MWFALGTFFIVVGIGLTIYTICHSIEVASHYQAKIIVDEFQKTRDMLTYFFEQKRDK